MQEKKVRLSDSDIEYLKRLFGKRYMFFLQLFSLGIIEKEALERAKNSDASDTDMKTIMLFEKFYKKANSDILSLMLAKIPAKQRIVVLYAFDKSPVERYIFSTLYSARKKNEIVKTKQILDYLKRYKHVDVESNRVKYVSMVKRIRKAVYRAFKKKEIILMINGVIT
jgi:hypothetical protein